MHGSTFMNNYLQTQNTRLLFLYMHLQNHYKKEGPIKSLLPQLASQQLIMNEKLMTSKILVLFVEAINTNTIFLLLA